MLKHEETSEVSSQSAAKVRVTPEELATALSRIEARQQEAARRQEEEERYFSETIPVDEAVRELDLKVAPEEIWAEVQILRQEKEEALISGENEADETFVTPYLSEANSPIVSVFSAVSSQKKKVTRRLISTFVLAALAFGIASPLLLHRTNFHKAATNRFAANSPSTYNAASFPDKIPFHLAGPAVVELLTGTDPSTISVAPEMSLGFQPFARNWEFIKYDGHLYLRGLVAAPPAGKSFSQRFLEIHNMGRPEIGFRPALVTLRLDHLMFCNYYQQIGMTGDSVSTISGMDEKIVVSNVRLDEHTWEMSKAVMSTNKPLLPLNIFAPSQATKNMLAIRRRVSNRFVGDQTAPPLSQMADELPFEMNENVLGSLLSGVPPAKLHARSGRILTMFPNDGGAWRLIKHDGKIYLRGWIASNAEVNQPFLHLYNFSTATELGTSPKQLTLCLDNTHYGPYGEIYSLPFEDWTGKLPKINSAGQIYDGAFYQQIVLSDAHLDKHAYEKW